jgi:hypothetical protein
MSKLRPHNISTRVKALINTAGIAGIAGIAIEELMCDIKAPVRLY